MRAVAYIRDSTIDQATEGNSLDAQKARIAALVMRGAGPPDVHADAGITLGVEAGRVAAWFAANGVTLDATDLHVDAWSTDNLPALQAALDAVCRAKGVLVVCRLASVARSTEDLLAVAERLEKAGADLVSLRERIDTTSAGYPMLATLAALADFERDPIRLGR